MLLTPNQPPRPWSTRLAQFAAPKFARDLALVLFLNSMVALILVTTGASRSFLDTFKISNSIGFSIWGSFELLRLLFGPRASPIVLAPLGIPIGFIVGTKLLAPLIGAKDLIAYTAQDPTHQWRLLVGSLMFTVFATSFFIFYWRAETYRADLQTERRRAAEAQQSELAARLALLQAQIEPHFLFNTLANAQSVIESDPQTAKRILEHLNQYLRVSLGRTRRATSSTLEDELGVINALLAISAMRLGNRLRYSINVPDTLKATQLPPLLLQPLVENALKHGIDPAVNGGEICIEVRQENDALSLRVTDTGVGLNASSPEGVGLANVRARLNSLYGDRGRLALYNHSPHGVVAEITLPLREQQQGHESRS